VKLRVLHKTAYGYSEPVSTSHHEAHLAPRDSEVLRTLAHDVAITPSPSVRRERFDYFGNRALHFSIREPHRELDVVSQSLVELTPQLPPVLAATPSWEEVRGRLGSDRRRDVLDAYAFTFDSPMLRGAVAAPEVADYAAPSFVAGRPVLEAARDLTRRIHADFRYDSEATEVATPVREVLRRRRGVCQDFAHLQIACLRAQGLAARYVSGYLLTRPPAGRPKLVGADASHAWVGTFVPDFGWVDFDPTNDLVPTDEHVTVAWGRDFSDVTPVKGVILGGGKHEVRVSVDVSVV
jgi:transglutaminase-like putative cysteine protease